jgi:15-cis-phytoene synthase
MNPKHQIQASSTDYAYCEEQLRRDDKDRWLASLFVPAELRPHIHALYAFSREIARVSETVSQPLLGEIRFQWWRDAIEGVNPGEAKASPVAAALLDTILRFDLPKAPLLKLIDARLSRDIYADPMESSDVLQSYAEATCANLFRLAMLILAGDEAAAGFGTAGHAGIAYGITGLLRALPWHSARGQVFVPEDILTRHGVTREQFAAALAGPHARAALADLRSLARGHLDAFTLGLQSLTGKIRPALLPASLCEPYLQLMEKPSYDPLRTIVELPQWKRQWILWRASRMWS